MQSEPDSLRFVIISREIRTQGLSKAGLESNGRNRQIKKKMSEKKSKLAWTIVRSDNLL